MSKARIAEFARNYCENGMKLLLEHSQNVHELLRVTQDDFIDRIDFEHLTRDPTTYVLRDYRHVEADLVYHAPLRRRKGSRSRLAIIIYILIEHQFEPDLLMPLRLADYVLQIYKAQVREWEAHHPSYAGLRLQPVLPVVFYTGMRRWNDVGRLVDLVVMGQGIKKHVPDMEPLFINLRTLPPKVLTAEGGFFGWMLRLVQQRRSKPQEFRAVLERVVRELEEMPAAERLRWLDLLSCVHALVYHDRDPSEQPILQQTIADSVATDEHRQEIFDMGKTIAEELRAEGRAEGMKKGAIGARQEMLLALLRERFGKLSKATVETVESTEDMKQLDEWIVRFATAKTLAQVGISSTK